MKSNKKVGSSKWPEHLKNEVRLKLLFALPEFQKDLLRIRKELGIPSDGLLSDDDYDAWDHRVMKTKESVGHLYSGLRMLGDKYKLPRHFYSDPYLGLLPWITRNNFRAPLNNWVIEMDPESKGSVGWLSIKTFAPLSKREIAHASKDLARLQKSFFPKQTIITGRAKKQFERDLAIYTDLSSRPTKPVRKEKYDGYLFTIRRSATPSKWRELKRIHKHDISVGYDEKTSRQKGREISVKAAAVRKAQERIRNLIRQFFGDSFLGH